MPSNERENYEAALEQLIRQRDALNIAIAAIQRHMDADHQSARMPANPPLSKLPGSGLYR